MMLPTIKERGVSYVQASQDLGVHVSQLRDWVKKFADDPEHAFPGHGQMKPEQLEIARLKREVTKLKAERDILKNVRGSFSSCAVIGLAFAFAMPIVLAKAEIKTQTIDYKQGDATLEGYLVYDDTTEGEDLRIDRVYPFRVFISAGGLVSYGPSPPTTLSMVNLGVELGPKRLELLHELIPTATP